MLVDREDLEAFFEWEETQEILKNDYGVTQMEQFFESLENLGLVEDGDYYKFIIPEALGIEDIVPPPDFL